MHDTLNVKVTNGGTHSCKEKRLKNAH